MPACLALFLALYFSPGAFTPGERNCEPNLEDLDSPWSSCGLSPYCWLGNQGMHGWPLLVHYCDTCHYNTPISYTSSVWTEEHTCTHVRSASWGRPSFPFLTDLSTRSAASNLLAQTSPVAAPQR